MHFAALYGNVDTVKVLLDNEANVNATNLWYNTPLHLAAFKDKTVTVMYLLKKGANKSAINIDENTAFHIASHYQHVSIMAALSQKGIDINEIAKINTKFNGLDRLKLLLLPGPLKAFRERTEQQNGATGKSTKGFLKHQGNIVKGRGRGVWT